MKPCKNYGNLNSKYKKLREILNSSRIKLKKAREQSLEEKKSSPSSRRKLEIP
jgi:hypothetical protein